MLRKALSTTVLATVLLTSSISATELTAPGGGSTAKVETISAFDAIPQTAQSSLTQKEMTESGEWIWVVAGVAVAVVVGGVVYYVYKNHDFSPPKEITPNIPGLSS